MHCGAMWLSCCTWFPRSALYRIALLSTALLCFAHFCTNVHTTPQNWTTLLCFAQNCTLYICFALDCSALHTFALNCFASHSSAQNLHTTSQNWTTLLYFARHFSALQSFVHHSTKLQDIAYDGAVPFKSSRHWINVCSSHCALKFSMMLNLPVSYQDLFLH